MDTLLGVINKKTETNRKQKRKVKLQKQCAARIALQKPNVIYIYIVCSFRLSVLKNY